MPIQLMATMPGLRVRCRNQRCRSKLPVPTDNEHKAFCTPLLLQPVLQLEVQGLRKPDPEGPATEGTRSLP
jgi:hypothetical protein